MDSLEAQKARDEAFDAVLIIVFALGVIGNALVFFTVFVSKENKKSITNWYVIHLGIADTLFLVTIILRASLSSEEYWLGSLSSCKANQSLLYINYYASVLFLMVMSIDRYIAVCRSFSSRMQKFRKRRAAYIVTLVVWIIAILLSIPVMIYTDKRGVKPNCFCEIIFPSETFELTVCKKYVQDYEGFEHDCPKERCISEQQNNDFYEAFYEYNDGLYSSEAATTFPHTSATTESDFINDSGINSTELGGIAPDDIYPDHYSYDVDDSSGVPDGCVNVRDDGTGRAHVWINFTVMFLLPLLVMSACYGLIVKKFRDSVMKSTGRRMSQKSAATDADRRRVTIMCIVLVAVFTVCWFLYHVVEIVKQYSYFSLSSVGCEILENASFVMIYINSALNPYLYSFLGTGLARKWQSVKVSSLGQRVVSIKSRSSKMSITTYRPRASSGGGNSTQQEQSTLKFDLKHSEDSAHGKPTNSGQKNDADKNLF